MCVGWVEGFFSCYHDNIKNRLTFIDATPFVNPYGESSDQIKNAFRRAPDNFSTSCLCWKESAREEEINLK